ncbi:MAG: ornithine carbamoyltransferase, partial [Clostridia bacterium]|nr:ornithine carbamoyltransferase [Clostridia bacterium]
LLTMREQFEDLAGRKVVYLGDARYNMGNSLMIGCALAGMKFVAAAPEKYWPNAELTARCKQIASVTGGSIDFSDNPEAAVKGADILYTDVWVSMGEPESVWEERIHDLLPFRVTQKLMDLAGPGCKFMHCLPSFHNTETDIGMDIYKKYGLDCMEVTEEVFEGNNSIVFDQSENRLHTIKAVMAATMAAV